MARRFVIKFCGPRKKGAYQHAIREAAEEHGLTRFVTLTLDPKKLGGDASDSVKHLRNSFNKFRVYLGRKFGKSIKYIAVIECQENGFAHLHLLVDRYIEQSWIKGAWSAVGGGQHVDIRHRDTPKIAAYLAKYLTKGLLGNCPKKSRRVTCSRGITLLRKYGKQHRWTLIRESIKWLFGRRAAVARDVEVDRNDRLVCFSVPTAVGKSLRYSSPGHGGWQVSLA
jgi:hypothetical protein